VAAAEFDDHTDAMNDTFALFFFEFLYNKVGPRIEPGDIQF
jgi:hypothetical protein